MKMIESNRETYKVLFNGGGGGYNKPHSSMSCNIVIHPKSQYTVDTSHIPVVAAPQNNL